MLATKLHRIAAAQSSPQQYLHPHSLTCTDWPSALIGSNVILGPGNEAIGLWPLQILHTRCRIALDQLRTGGPLEQAAHSVNEMPRLKRCRFAPLPAVNNMGAANLADLLRTSRRQNVA